MQKAHFKMKLPELMRKQSVERGDLVTQARLARETGLSYPTISRLYNENIERLEAETVRRLTEHFGCTLADLIEVE